MELGDFFLDKPEKIRYTREAVKGKALIGGSPVKLEELELSLLFDYYGELLTEKQREYFDLHYNEDLSLAEIAALTGISRQGVWDIIRRAEATLRDIEAKTGLVARFRARREALSGVEARLSGLLSSPDAEARRVAREVMEELRGLDD